MIPQVLLSKHQFKGQIRWEYVRLEADRVQNSGVSRDSHGNGKGRMKWALTSRNQSLD